MNVHYFFISNRSQYETDIEYIKIAFDEVLSTFSNEMQAHWKDHLQFVNARVSEMDNWLDDALSGEYAISIDCFQRIREEIIRSENPRAAIQEGFGKAFRIFR